MQPKNAVYNIFRILVLIGLLLIVLFILNRGGGTPRLYSSSPSADSQQEYLEHSEVPVLSVNPLFVPGSSMLQEEAFENYFNFLQLNLQRGTFLLLIFTLLLLFFNTTYEHYLYKSRFLKWPGLHRILKSIQSSDGKKKSLLIFKISQRMNFFGHRLEI